MEIIREEDFDVTLSGGDPLYNPKAVKELCEYIRKEGHTVWLYTGFTWEEIQERKDLLEAIQDVEAVVDGPYIEEMRDPDLPFRGSANQRIIYLNNELRRI